MLPLTLAALLSCAEKPPELGDIHPETTPTTPTYDPDGPLTASEVVVVDHVVDAASGTFGVRLALPNPDHSLPAGLKCHVSFGGEAAADTGESDELDPS